MLPRLTVPFSQSKLKASLLQIVLSIKYLDVGPQAQLPPPYAEDISALLTMVLSYIGPFRNSIA